MTSKHVSLVDTMTKAKQAAAALQGTKDEGTFNFDSCVIFVGRQAKGLTKALMEAGVHHHEGHWFGRKVLFTNFEGEGNCSRRTSMAEAAYKVMKAAGLDVQMYYQMD